MVPRDIHLQQRGVALANGVADILLKRGFRVYVSNFSRIPVRLVNGMNIGTVRPLIPEPHIGPSVVPLAPIGPKTLGTGDPAV